MLILRPLSLEEFPLLVPYGYAFFREYEGHVNGVEFRGDVFLESMELMAQWYDLTVFGLFTQAGTFVGGLAAYLQPDIFTKDKVARDVFVYIDPAYRGGTNALRLITAYQDWAKSHGARYAFMVHLHHGPLAEKFQRVFEALGYVKMETAYRLAL